MPRLRFLPSPPVPEPGRPLVRARAFFLASWAGRLLLATLALLVLDKAGVPLPCGLAAVARVLLFLYCGWGAFRMAAFLVRRLLWRIRTKLLVSYLFIAVVPLVLLLVLFLLSGVLFSGLVASHIVTASVDASADRLRTVAESALAALPADDARAKAAVETLVAPARSVHPGLSYTLLRGGKPLARSGLAPEAVPAWIKPPGFAGLVKQGEGEFLRAVELRGPDALLLDAPVDAALFASLEEHMGIHFLTSGGTVRHDEHGVQIRVSGERGRLRKVEQAGRGISFPATPEARKWEDGETEVEPIAFQFQPFDLVRRLAPGTFNMGDLLVKVLAAVAGVFLVVYVFALGLGLLLARSVTKNVHELYQGTERLRQGDFSRPIPVQSRDQLGELAESFNLMAQSVQDLLLEQAEKQRLEEELRIARQIQMSLLPQGEVTMEGIRVAALCLPAAEVGGDYYDLLPLSPTRMGVLVADVSGKGTSAALYMAELKGLVLSLSRMYESPARLLGEANRILAANMDARSFITMTYAVVDTAARTMRYARAGHNPLIHLEAATGRTRVLTPQGLGLGIDPGDRFEAILEEAEVPLVTGDVFVFFTDGLSEAMNDRAELFGGDPAAGPRRVDGGRPRRGCPQGAHPGRRPGVRGGGGPARRHDHGDPQGGMNAPGPVRAPGGGGRVP